jgi:hypothetical protein
MKMIHETHEKHETKRKSIGNGKFGNDTKILKNMFGNDTIFL